ncbi:MAG: hypothetical protein ACJ76J_24100 [Thermoanaerobaculia bacterium]
MRTSLVALAAALAGGRLPLETIWSFFTSAWSASCADEGLGMDPNGGCRPVPGSDAGLIMDPSGSTAPRTDEGLGMDRAAARPRNRTRA